MLNVVKVEATGKLFWIASVQVPRFKWRTRVSFSSRISSQTTELTVQAVRWAEKLCFPSSVAKSHEGQGVSNNMWRVQTSSWAGGEEAAVRSEDGKCWEAPKIREMWNTSIPQLWKQIPRALFLHSNPYRSPDEHPVWVVLLQYLPLEELRTTQTTDIQKQHSESFMEEICGFPPGCNTAKLCLFSQVLEFQPAVVHLTLPEELLGHRKSM